MTKLDKGNNTDNGKKVVNVGHVLGDVFIGESPEYQVGSAINELLNSLASKDFKFNQIKRSPSAETIVKIEHNNLHSKSHIIKQYLDHSSKIEEAYSDVDKLITFGKDTILNNLQNLYYAALDTAEISHLYTPINIEQVRNNSDFILEYIINKLKNTVFKSNNTPSIREQIDHGVNVVVAHAFIECVIMENPNDDS